MYQLSVVVDDIDMRITHVIRGADHHFQYAEAGAAVRRARGERADVSRMFR